MAFRELRRFKQKLNEEECIAVLKSAKRGVLSVMGLEGYPYGMPLNHYYKEEDGKLYMHCGYGGHREEALKQNPKVSFTVMDEGTKDEENWWLVFRSVIVFGTAEFVRDEEEIYRISRELSHKFTDDDAYIEQEIENAGRRTAMLAVTIDHMSGKRVTER